MFLIRLGREDAKIIVRDLGAILILIGYLLIFPAGIAWHYGEEYLSFLALACITIWAGFLLKKLYEDVGETKLKHAMVSAGLAWLLVPLVSCIPFLRFTGFLDAYFESMSGFTTTGLTVFSNVELLPKSILFWRALIQWVGGIGVVMLFLLILMQVGIGVARFYMAEGRGERIAPTISSTVRKIWKLYFIYTIFGIVLYYIAGMSLFDAICHTFTALATAGFSTKNASISSYNSAPIEIVSIILMFIGGVSFLLHYKLLTGKKSEVIEDPEMRLYVGVILFATFLIGIDLFLKGNGIVESFNYALFHVVSAITTTGFSISDLSSFPDFSKAILALLMLSGGCAGSTAGGIKVFRILILVKLAYHQNLKEILPSSSVITFKIKEKVMEDEDLLRITTFFFLYTSIVFVIGIILTEFGLSFVDGLAIAASAQGNVGLVTVSSMKWFSLPSIAKLLLIIQMWAGRLEIYPAFALIYALALSWKKEK